MVGREVELLALQHAYRDAMEAKQTHVVTVVGEAGVGKSRLLYEFQNWLELLADVALFFQGRGRQETQSLPYAMLKDVFTFRFQIQESDAARDVRYKIEKGFGDVFGADDEGQMRAHIIGQLLGFDFNESQYVKGIIDDPQQIHDRALMYLAEYFQRMSEGAPTVIFLEDVHWADDSSLNMINNLAHRIPEQRLLIVCLARERLFERRPYWGEGLDYHIQLELHPLSKPKSCGLVNEILKKVDQVPEALQELVVRGAEGNPFYIEELIKMLIEDGVIITGEERWRIEIERLEQIEVPETLTGVLQARLEGLPPDERNTLQQASVVGRIFWDDTVEYMSFNSTLTDKQTAIGTMEENLSSLRSRELIYHREESAFIDTAEYTFKHAVLRDVTYESVLKRLRKVYHELVAAWLIENSGERSGEFAGLIADHLERAGNDAQAAIYLYQAGEQALRSFANSEAESYFRRAMNITSSKDDQAKIFMELGEALYNQSRYNEAIQVWHEGIGIFKDLGNIDGVARLYARSSRAAWHDGDTPKGLTLCLEGMETIADAPESSNIALLMHETGRAYYFNGLPDEALPICQQALAIAERQGAADVQADTLTTLGILPNQSVEDVLRSLNRTVEIAEANNLLEIASRAHHNLGAMKSNLLGDQQAELDHYMKASDLDRKRGDGKEELFNLVSAALILNTLGDFAEVENKLPVLESLLSNIPESGPSQRSVNGVKFGLLISQGIFLRLTNY